MKKFNLSKRKLSNVLLHNEIHNGASTAPDYSIVEEGDNLKGIFKDGGNEMEVQIVKTFTCPFMK